ncbi:glycosyltransferase [Lentisphaerota bacterium ZTH]|nr:glycosyltransferase [Lentisphaerota bacterium]WET06392.1 glycosyltransferase [Lentisphaerota bacterium ZTH]
MRVALLHYWLTNIRGGENVFLEICRMYPEADIFTHVICPKIKEKFFPGRNVFTSYVNYLPGAAKYYKNYISLMLSAAKTFELSDYDLIISSESGQVKGISKPTGAKHICYCHTPMRYVWDMFDDYCTAAPVHKKIAMKVLKRYLRQKDIDSTATVDSFIANSAFVKGRISRIYNRSANVIYPPVDYSFFSSGTAKKADDYYLMAGQLVRYKRPDIAIRAFNQNGKRLVVSGTGKEYRYLKSIAKPNISFTGWIDKDSLRDLYTGAKALIFPGIEDFGIVPLEAQAAGVPVIAFAGGGALETVLDNTTGILFKQQNSVSLNLAVQKFESETVNFNAGAIQSWARQFSSKCFIERFKAHISKQLS